MADIEQGITITFRGNTASFDASIGNIEKAMKVVQADTKQLNKELKLDPTNVNLLNEKLKNLQATLQLNEKAVRYYREEILKAIEPSKELANSEKYKQLVQQLENAEKKVSDYTKKLRDANKANMDVTNPEEWKKLNSEYTQANIELDKITDDMLTLVQTDYTVLDWKRYTDNMRQYEQTLGNVASLNMQIANTTDKIDHNKAYVLGERLGTIGEKAKVVGQSLTEAGKAVKWFSAIAAGALTGAVKAAADFETAWKKVEKVVQETTTTTYDDLKQQIKDMAATIPVDLNTITEAFANAGQLGVNTDVLNEFVETMLRLDSATNLTAEDAATSIAQLYNVMGADISTVDKFASALVHLGNTSATTEKDILEMASTIGASASNVHFTTEQILGLADALAGSGLNPSSAGTAISTILTKIDKLAAKSKKDLYKYNKSLKQWQLNNNGIMLKALADLLGFTGNTEQQLAKLKKAWTTDSAGTFERIIEGMSKAQDAGENLNNIMEKLGFTGIKQDSTIKALVNSYPLLETAMDNAAMAYDKGTKAVEESELAWETFNSKLTLLKNNLQVLGLQIGDALLPFITSVVEKITEWVQKWQQMDEGTKNLIIRLLTVVAVLSPILLTLGKIFTTVGNLFLLGKKLAELFPILADLAPFLGWAAAIAGVLALIYIFKDEIIALWNAFLDSEFWATITEKFKALGDTIKAIVDWVISLFETIANLFTKVWNWLKKISQVYSSEEMRDIAQKMNGGSSSATTPPLSKDDLSLNDTYSGGLGVRMVMSGGTSLSLQTTIQVNNNGTPIDESEIRRWGNVITNIVSDNLGKRW